MHLFETDPGHLYVFRRFAACGHVGSQVVAMIERFISLVPLSWFSGFCGSGTICLSKMIDSLIDVT